MFFFGFGFGNGELRRETTTELSLLLCLNVRISDNLLGPEAAAGQARPTQATAELPLSVNRCRPNVVFRLSSFVVVDENEMPNKRPSMEFRRRREGNPSRAGDVAEISEGSGAAGGAHGRYDLIMIKEPLAALPAGCPPARTFSVGEVAGSMSDIYSEALFFHSSVLYMVLPSC